MSLIGKVHGPDLTSLGHFDPTILILSLFNEVNSVSEHHVLGQNDPNLVSFLPRINLFIQQSPLGERGFFCHRKTLSKTNCPLAPLGERVRERGVNSPFITQRF
jgi:hypothetical protein